jgi:triosephosphate isomerase
LGSHVNETVAADTRIVFGGSVTETNGPNLIKQADLDGFLMGSTSVKPIFRTMFDIVEQHATQQVIAKN